MKRLAIWPRPVLFLSAFFYGLGGAMVFADTLPTTTINRRTKPRKTECFVVATEAKRVAPIIALADPFARELWSLISENNNTREVLDRLQILKNRDVLQNGTAPSGLGWRPQYLDTAVPGRNQRHHYGFYHFIGAADESEAQILARLGGIVNDVYDFLEGNEGDLRLAAEGRRVGGLAKTTSNTKLVSGQVKEVSCNP